MSVEATRYVATRPPTATVPKAGAFHEKKPPPTNFKVMYQRGDLPLRVNSGIAKYVFWHIPELPRTAYKALAVPRSAGSPE